MSRTTRPEGDGYAVEVSLLKPKPSALAPAVACFVALVALLGWLGGDSRQLAASRPAANHATNQERRAATAAIPNSATSRPAQPADAVPGPSPAGFADDTASGDTPAETPATPQATPDAVAAAAPAVAATNATNPTAPTAATAAPFSGGYAVQVGSYNTLSEANERVSSLRAAGFEARAAAVEIAGRGTWHRVYSGRFAAREEAAQHDRKLRAAGAVAATIIAAVQD